MGAQRVDDGETAATADNRHLSRHRAATYLVAAPALLVIGWRCYRSALTPSGAAVDVFQVQFLLSGAHGEATDLPAGAANAFKADFWFVLGYGSALVIAAFLARHVFRSAGARAIARVGLPLALVAVAADVVENLLLLWATGELFGAGPVENPELGRLLHVVTGAAVLKVVCFVPAAGIGITALLVTLGRLVMHTEKRLARRPLVTVLPPDPLEGDPPARAQGDRAEGPSRWRRGFRVPGVQPRHQKRPVIGFALSGGGIRSASVALGALQSLRTELQRARYLVSVSGGGYTAGSLQLALNRAVLGRDEEEDGRVVRDPASTHMPGSVEEDRVRRHARYLADSPIEILVALGVVARGLLLSLAVLFAPAVVLGAAVGLFYREVPLGPLRGDRDALMTPDIPLGTWGLLVLLLGVAFASYVLSLLRAAYSGHPRAGGSSRRAARAVTGLLLITAAMGVGVPWLIYGAGWLLEEAGSSALHIGAPVVGVVLTYVVTLATFLRRKKVFDSFGLDGTTKKSTKKAKKAEGKGTSIVAAVPGGALQLIMVVLTLLLLGAAWLVLAASVAWVATGPDRSAVVTTALGVLAVLLLLGVGLDQTTLSLHPFYRRRLAEAFAARRVQRPDGYVEAEPYRYEERTALQSYGSRVKDFPEVVFAAAANLTGERRAPLGAASFTMTARWVGGPDVGYVPTSELRRVVRPPFQRDLTVQAAMAISGAAFASAAGRLTRWYSTLLAVTGLRLGTWLPNPAFLDSWEEARTTDDWTLPGLPRQRRLTYLLREVLDRHRYTDRLLQVTDGGHYENLGLVEALRRRCTEIYCIDASGDTPPTAGTFEQAITLAYAELGVRITLDSDDVWRLVPGSGKAIDVSSSLEGLNKRLSERSVVTASICYPPESELPDGHRHGILVFAKALLTRDATYDVLSYAARNEAFPHDTTGDQFFDDGKFTAYAALGRHIGGKAQEAMVAARNAQRAQQPCPLETACPSWDGVRANVPPQRGRSTVPMARSGLPTAGLWS